MTTAIGRLGAISRKTLLLMAAGLAFIAGTLGTALDVADAKTIECSHVLETCNGTWGNDQIYGWQNQNGINANAGLDDVWGREAFDNLIGDSEADALFGGDDGDNVYGGPGNDSYYKVGGGAGFGVYGNSGWDRTEGNVGYDLVQGDTGQDGMYGGDNEDMLFAEDSQPDTVQGGGQVDGCWVDQYDSWAGCEGVY